MCNDELQSRFWSMQGTKAFFERYMVDHVEKGRALSAPLVTFTMWLGFWGNSSWSFRIVQILSILICVCLFGVLINKLFNNTRFAYFCALFSLLFMPVSFEHTSPNAFNALYNFWLGIYVFFCRSFFSNKKQITSREF